MNPYDIDVESLKESKKITGEKNLLKLKLIKEFIKITNKMETADILSITGLDKSDFSRLNALSFDRFTIDRIVGFLDRLGYSTSIKVKPKQVS